MGPRPPRMSFCTPTFTTPPLTLPPTTLGWLDYKLLSLFPDPDFPTTSNVTRRVTIRTHEIIGQGSVKWAQDESPWIESFLQEPYLVSLYKNDSINFPSLDRAHANHGIDPVTRGFHAALARFSRSSSRTLDRMLGVWIRILLMHMERTTTILDLGMGLMVLRLMRRS